ncbi:mannosyltransferase [Ceratobasidium sp. 428]|nr:mannosyltransferase [Ceratobasidium sp. 428]
MQSPFGAITPLDALVCLGIIGTIVYTARVYNTRAKEKDFVLQRPETSNTASKVKEKAARDEMDRSPGEWQPQSFKYPIITPWTDFDFEKTLPPPYRPFRWGPTYNITMGIRSMDFSEWIQVGH